MRTERRRHRRARAELRTDRGVVGDEGVDQLQRNYLLFALVLLEPAQVGAIEAVANRRREHGAERQIDEKAATGARADKPLVGRVHAAGSHRLAQLTWDTR